MKVNVQIDKSDGRILVVYKTPVEGISTEIDLTEGQLDELLDGLGNFRMLNGKLVYYAEFVESQKRRKNLIFFRNWRASQLRAFDLWEKAVLRKREPDSASVMRWYEAVKCFPDKITTYTAVGDYPSVPEAVKKYLC